MNITLTGRQMEITPDIRSFFDGRIQAVAADFGPLLISSVGAVVTREKNRFSATVVLNCKYHVMPATVTDFEAGKALDKAVSKIESQLKTLYDKIRMHQGEPLCDCEAAKAAETL